MLFVKSRSLAGDLVDVGVGHVGTKCGRVGEADEHSTGLSVSIMTLRKFSSNAGKSHAGKNKNAASKAAFRKLLERKIT
jgi:hypothetical protein